MRDSLIEGGVTSYDTFSQLENTKTALIENDKVIHRLYTSYSHKPVDNFYF